MENIGNKTLITGESFSFGDDYVFVVNALDGNTKKADLTLTKGATTLFSKWFSEGALIDQPNVLKVKVYSITSSLSGGETVLKLTDIIVIGQSAPAEDEPTSGMPIPCIENWQCSLWRPCSNGIQTRECIDLNDCGTTENKPSPLNKSCRVQRLPGCTESWRCSQWSKCTNNQFIRFCIDMNVCGTTNDKPLESLPCIADTPAPDSDPNNPDNPNPGDPNNPLPDPNDPNFPNPNDPNNPLPDPNDPNFPGGAQGGSSHTTSYKFSETYEIFNFPNITLFGIPIGPDIFNPESIISIIVFLILLIILLIFYLYISSAFSAIARKGDFSHPGVAWIPFIGPLIVASSLAEMHWWPILLLIFEAIQFIPSPIIGFFLSPISSLAMFVLTIFAFIWMWKTLTSINRPGWWVLFNLVPILGNFIFLILLGVAAWGNKEAEGKAQSKKKKSSK
jgi:hypothetical protein